MTAKGEAHNQRLMLFCILSLFPQKICTLMVNTDPCAIQSFYFVNLCPSFIKGNQNLLGASFIKQNILVSKTSNKNQV